ncbi:NAD(P)-binding protein [Chloropicon primus]|uniref:NAD(P)-binding protein n=1 Tax=Chloropicon primus TaxID=1764295 RepID=A0A5B8MR56_9CHLO|nr:NAD(P)-binding protein [Chloropicon primus]UPR02183.1 NAD(P)-binding protein [Chloropicon primus]|mmetsp:Transcript_2370/g.6566  ORF Transcript_2370/g.6566 Transcript_2370/m.6566 type:complete len:295 (+) Transcript_2370:112-996(+)|eukprot:QDZ22966.1 NAD(P)-binding protein [Chloropicon primus]
MAASLRPTGTLRRGVRGGAARAVSGRCLGRSQASEAARRLERSRVSRSGANKFQQSARERSLAARASSKYVFDPDNSSILVAGGGGVGIMVTRMLKDMGAWVWMLQRTDERRADIEKMMAIVINGDARNDDDVSRVFEEIDDLDAVVSTIGGSPADPSSDSVGNINLIEAAAAKGVKRFVLVTSIGTGSSRDAPPSQVYDVLKPCLVEKEKAEERLKELSEKMEFIIIRPGGLKSEPKTGNGVLTKDTTVCGPIHREDVASLVCKCLFSPDSANQVYSAVDKEQTQAEFETVDL